VPHPPTLQKKSFEFLTEHFQSQHPFTLEELRIASGWPASTFRTYFKKQLQDLVDEISPGIYRVSEIFILYSTWKRFQTVVSQRRILRTPYKETRSGSVVMYEFYMPLKHETALKDTLDSLFYRDIIDARLKNISIVKLRHEMQGTIDDANNDKFIAKVIALVADKFG
jgi:hypothetical protein